MLLGIVVTLLTVAALASFLLALRRSATAPQHGALPVDHRPDQLERLAVGALVDHDDRTWTVRGVQRIDAGWTAWHLEDKAQRALLAIDEASARRPAAGGHTSAGPTTTEAATGPDAGDAGADDAGAGREVVFSVGAERVADLDPEVAPLHWRDLDWRPVPERDHAVAAATGEGERALWKSEEAVPATASVERRSFANPHLARRRLTFLREDGGAWAVWIGDVVPATTIEVSPPRPVAATDA
ncbi:DUF4178 domain-containing protein [Patulibacter brassicae]|uniref:DUF4178 domain-containing protein n=1 Tax=Patulibacter brassicae TaxID=1705717 RepID=A0ABU4VLS7_9ACTN|nr:DUF4178 domain-containing protein [Patulibacter brassicae]MDX8151833.1 DUF4178 domain-containing protein [Patulibacter brassicae]